MTKSAGLSHVARLVRTGLTFVGFLVLVVTLTPVVTWWARAMAGPWNDPEGDTLIVLGGSMVDNGTLGSSSYWRSLYAVLAYQQGSFKHVVLSGGGKAGNSVAEAMRDFMACRGVPREVILVEARSMTTRENALYTKLMVEHLPGRKVLMTSDYHMSRAYRAFRKAGLDVIPRPIPDALKRGNFLEDRWGIFVELSRETAGLVYYLARGWI